MAGMIVPRYWAEGRLQVRREKRQVTVRRWGWSDESPEAAQKLADSRAQEALEKVLSGQKLARREPKVAYNGAEGVPIREEIVSQKGETIITRNVYGALCLNTPDVLFADIDFRIAYPRCGWWAAASWIGGGAGVFIGSKIGARAAAGGCLLGGLVALVALWAVATLIHYLMTGLAGGNESRARGRIARFVRRHPDWNVRIYRTPAGMRALTVHRRFDPTSPEVAQFFKALDTDPVYVRMCQRQHCFRARVSPKPWRVGIPRHMKPASVWPVNPKRRAERDLWVAEYGKASATYSSCRYLGSVGSDVVDHGADSVRILHDDLSRALTSLPMG